MVVDCVCRPAAVWVLYAGFPNLTILNVNIGIGTVSNISFTLWRQW
jgi:hypothetical protein